MKRLVMISDIHGCVDAFIALLEKLDFNNDHDQLILLGDYVDRGPNSKETVELVMKLVSQSGAVALRGNHDQRLVDLVFQDDDLIRKKFIEHGGLPTLHSYCGYKVEADKLDTAIAFIRTQYSKHLEFLRTCPLYHEDEHHIYVHAGLNPAFYNWKEQPSTDFMYIKEDFHQHSFSLSKRIVFGHTRTIELHEKPDIWFQPDKIGIDGGCAYGLQLNALTLWNGIYTSYHIQASQRSGL